MLLTIALTLMAIFALAAAELWLFWWLGDRDDRRRRLRQAGTRVDHPARQTPAPQHGARVRPRPSLARRRLLARR